MGQQFATSVLVAKILCLPGVDISSGAIKQRSDYKHRMISSENIQTTPFNKAAIYLLRIHAMIPSVFCLRTSFRQGDNFLLSGSNLTGQGSVKISTIWHTITCLHLFVRPGFYFSAV